MRFITLKKEHNNYSQCSAFALPHVCTLFFTLNTVVFVDRGCRNIPCPRARGTLATPLLLSPNTILLSSDNEFLLN